MRSPSRQFESILILVLFALCCGITTTALAIHAPITNDHTIHLAKLALMKKQLLTEHRWWGWTHDLLFGYPLNYTYPSLGYAMVLALDLLSGPILSLDDAYVVVLNLTACSLVLGVYFWARRLAGPNAAFLAGFMVVLDAGGPHYGGYLWFAGVGVWACQLALALHLFFLYFLTEALASEHRRKAALSGLFLGLSILAHPLSGVASVLAFSALLLSLIGKSQLLRIERSRVLGRLSLIAVTGYLLSAVWIVPYLSVKEYTRPFAKEWLSIPEILSQIATGSFAHMSPYLLVLGLLGFLNCLRRPEISARIVTLYTLSVVLFGSTTFLETTGLQTIFRNFEMIRLQIFIRPFFCVSAGVLLALLARYVYPDCFSPQENLSSFRWSQIPEALKRYPSLGIVLLFVGTTGAFRYSQHLESLSFRWLAKEPAYTLSTRNTLIAELKKELKNKEGFVRIHVIQGSQRPRTLMDLCRELGSPVSFGPFYPATNVRYGNAHGEARLYVPKYGVGVLVKDVEMTKPGQWELASRAGPWWIYRAPPPLHQGVIGVKRGKARITNLVLGSNEIRFQVSHVNNNRAEGEIWLYMCPFPRWKLSINGEPAPWDKATKKGLPDSALRLPLAEGEYRLSFETGNPERVGSLLTILGLLLALSCFSHRPLGLKALAGGSKGSSPRTEFDEGTSSDEA